MTAAQTKDHEETYHTTRTYVYCRIMPSKLRWYCWSCTYACLVRFSQGPSFRGRATAHTVTARYPAIRIYCCAIQKQSYVRLLGSWIHRYACRQESRTILTFMPCAIRGRGDRLQPTFTTNKYLAAGTRYCTKVGAIACMTCSHISRPFSALSPACRIKVDPVLT